MRRLESVLPLVHKFATVSAFTVMAQSVALATLPLGSAVSQPAAATVCDILTAHPDDANRVAEPVPFNERDAARAIPACEEAVRQHPSQPRLRYQLGLAYDSARRYAESFSSYQQAANADYIAAGFALGWAYANGEGTPRDDAAAIRSYQWAAERGHSAAQNTLGFMYENGRGVTASLSQAAEWYRRAHEQGRPIGAANYGRMLALGYGGPVGTPPALRRTLAATVLRQAVQQDRPDAALQLALIAERGEVQIDRSELIHLWAFAEARSSDRERARRSLQRLAAQGAGAEIEQARAAVAQRQTVLDTERNGAREAREAALRRLAMAPAQSGPIQPNIRGTSPASGAAPAPAMTSAPAMPSSGSTRTADPSSDPNQWSRVANLARAWMEPWTRDPLAVAGSAVGLTLSLCVLGFWLGKRRGQQALRAAKVMQRTQSASTPSIAGVYLSPQQGAHAATATATSQPSVAGPRAPTALPTPAMALDVARSATEVKRGAPIQVGLAAFETPRTAGANAASEQPTVQSTTDCHPPHDVLPSRAANELEAQQAPYNDGAVEGQNAQYKAEFDKSQLDDKSPTEELKEQCQEPLDISDSQEGREALDDDKNSAGAGASTAMAEFSRLASAGRIPLLDLIRLMKEVKCEIDVIAFGSVVEFIENVEWCRAHKGLRYEIFHDAEIDIGQANTLASIPILSRNASCRIRLTSDAESLQRIWKERKFINSYIISGDNRISHNLALLICSFGEIELQHNATFIVYGNFQDLMHCIRDKNVQRVATGYDLTGYNIVSRSDYENIMKIPNFRIASGAVLEQKNTIFATDANAIHWSWGRYFKIATVVGSTILGGYFILEFVIDNRPPRERAISFLQYVIRDRCAMGISEFRATLIPLINEMHEYERKFPQSRKPWHSDEYWNLFVRAERECV